MITEILRRLTPAIENIDGKCPYCIREFIKDVNIILIEYGVKFVYDETTHCVTLNVLNKK